nr:hypothetical protein [Tanacetum cinerariifolium]
MFIQPHDPDFVPETIYPEYIPLEDEHILLAEEQPLPPVVSPTAESPGCTIIKYPINTRTRTISNTYQGVEESPKTPHFHNDPLHETLHEDSTSQGSSLDVRPSHTLFELLGKWTKNHPIENMIGDPSRSNYNEAMLEPSWIDAMQKEIHELERLQVWELVPYLDLVMLIKLKWIFKVKKDECGGVLENKARLVAKGY